MSAKKILVTGANGQLGKEFRRLEKNYPSFEFVFADRTQLPIEDRSVVEELINTLKPYACINCAAYTAVDKAESEKEKAEMTNGYAVGFLAEVCRENNAILIHVSTDYVFDGSSVTPYKETDATGPINQYGLTKLNGERLAIEKNPASIVIRTSWVYSEFGNNFVKTMMRLMNEKESINVVDDQVGSPTYAADLANAIMQMLSTIQNRAANAGSSANKGIFHYSNEGAISWYEFAVAIKEITGSRCKVNPIPSVQYPTPARRPKYSLLDKSKIKFMFSLEIPEWRESLKRCIERLQQAPSKVNVKGPSDRDGQTGV